MKKQEVQIVKLSLVDADENQPRKNFDASKLANLVSSIKKHGIMNPLIVEVKKLDTIPALEEKLAEARVNLGRETGRADGNATIAEDLRKEVARLDELVKFIAGKLPVVDLKELGISLNADIAVNGGAKKEEKKPQ